MIFHWVGGKEVNKYLMTGPKGNSEFCFPKTLNVSLAFASGNIEVEGSKVGQQGIYCMEKEHYFLAGHSG